MGSRSNKDKQNSLEGGMEPDRVDSIKENLE